MADIKTRDVVKGTVRTIDKAAVAGQRMKHAYIATKEKAEHSVEARETSTEEYAADRFEAGTDTVVHEGAHALDKAGRKGVQTTKENLVKAKDGVERFKQKRAEQSLRRQTSQSVQRQTTTTTGRQAAQTGKSSIKTVEQTGKTVKQSATSAGKKTIKTVGRGTARTAQKTVKTAEQTAKATIKTAKQSAKAAQKTAQAKLRKPLRKRLRLQKRRLRQRFKV